MKLFSALTGLTLAMSLARTASAGDVDWMRVLVDADAVARRGAEILDTPRCQNGLCTASPSESSGVTGAGLGAVPVTPLTLPSSGSAWFGVSPRVSLVARDWASAFKVAGDRLALVDAMRLTSSTRMVMSRVRLSDRRITPFAQLGLGQWRIDPILMPHTPRQLEIAAQLGGGFEVALLRNWQIAAEASSTLIYREELQPGQAPIPKMWSAVVASRIDF